MKQHEITPEIEDRVVLLDNGGETFDRYTSIIDGDHENARGMSENPFHPQGFGCTVTCAPEYVQRSIDAGHRIKVADAPEKVQDSILQDLRSIDEPR